MRFAYVSYIQLISMVYIALNSHIRRTAAGLGSRPEAPEAATVRSARSIALLVGWMSKEPAPRAPRAPCVFCFCFLPPARRL